MSFVSWYWSQGGVAHASEAMARADIAGPFCTRGDAVEDARPFFEPFELVTLIRVQGDSVSYRPGRMSHPGRAA
jgi:hypothetical protein